MQKFTPILLTFAVLAAPALAQEALPGKELFFQHCATCHGINADGKGPMAGVLVIKPANLTRLNVENDGEFPLTTVIKRIDGREPLVSHGSPMPVYGYFFEGSNIKLKTEAGQKIRTSQPIVDLVEWIKSVQIK